MKRTAIGLATASVLALGVSATAAPPSGPFTPDSNTVLLMHFDNNLSDASTNAYNGTMTAIGGYTDPSYVAGQASYGQCLEGNGAATLNGVQLPNATGQIPVTPLTIEGWVYVPTPTAGGNFCVLSLAADRIQFRLGYANGNSNVYPTIDLYNGGASQYDQTDFTPSDGWTFDAWHHVAATYQPSGTPRVKFFLDGAQKVGFSSINSEWQRVSFPGLTAGHVWPDPATVNTMPLNGKIDEVRLSNVLRYGASDVLLHMEFNGDYTDSSAYDWPTTLTAIPGFADPNFVAAPAPYGQAIESDGQGGLLNGVYIPNTALSQVDSPLTIEWRMKFPASALGQEFSNTIVDLAAGRFLLTMRHASNDYFHPQLSIYRDIAGTLTPEWTYCSITSETATLDVWHDFKMTYDPSQPSSQMVKFTFDGLPVAPEGGTKVAGAFDKVAENPLLAGRVWGPAAPTQNLMPLNGTLDDIKITSGVQVQADLSTSVTAAQATITVDGNPAEWAALASQATPLNTGGRAQLTCNVKYAWDANYLYYLVQEGPGDTVQKEAASGVAYEGAPWDFDTVAFWTAFVPSSLGEQDSQDFSPWFGFSSAGRTDLITARINNTQAYSQVSLLNASIATSGAIGSNNRVIEARVKWSDLAAVIDTARQPVGGLVGAIAAGYQFGCQPLLVDNTWTGQSFIGGAQFACPSGTDVNSRNVVLISSPSGISDWTLY